jgi:signal transduction histidine kinase
LLVKVQDLRFRAGRLAQRENQAVILIQRQVDHLILGALAVLTLLSVTLLTWLIQRLIRSLSRLEEGMARVAGGDLTDRVPVERDDELGRLAASFNSMTHRLGAANRQVEERTKALAHRTAELEAANADLEAFSYSVSHDLRAPLRAIDGFAAILREDYAPRLDAEGVRLLAVVSDNAVRMGQLIDDILAFSRAGRQTLHLARLDMRALVQEVWTGLEPQRAGRLVELRLPDDLPPAQGDPSAIRQIWHNLLGNAVKFSRQREVAVIEVAGRRESGETIYYIADNGAGFDPAFAASCSDCSSGCTAWRSSRAPAWGWPLSNALWKSTAVGWWGRGVPVPGRPSASVCPTPGRRGHHEGPGFFVVAGPGKRRVTGPTWNIGDQDDRHPRGYPAGGG